MTNFSYHKKQAPAIQAVKMEWDDDGEPTSVYPHWLIYAVGDGTVYQSEDGEWCIKYKGSYAVIQSGDYLVKEGEHLRVVSASMFESMYEKI